jgi:hypothetical protein
MTNQFSGFSSDSFEQFVRSLAVAVLGPGITAFGDGPDGGREATFTGRIPYPFPPTAQWSGYGVIQAKCKLRQESTSKDLSWTIAQLKTELDAFVSSKKRSPKPEYYIFVTNVELSSAPGGGRSKCEALIANYYAKIPLKGHAIWDSNQLNVLLANHHEVRNAFGAYLTPGDLIAKLIAQSEQGRTQATYQITAFLEREILSDETSRLDQAGNRTEEQLRLARLFFDLPATPEASLTPPKENTDRDGRLPHGVLFEILRAGSRKLDSRTVYEQETSSSGKTTLPFPTRYVLLGGPGSGKSTIGQFLAQIHRAAILDRRDPRFLVTQTRQAIKETKEFCEREDLLWPATPRLPFRVELNRFAKALASGEVTTLEGFILNSVSRDHTATLTDFLDWIKDYPCLLILDGLDEVPASSNRGQLVRSVNEFVASTRQIGLDLFIVATSREQGYSGEFATNTVGFRHILPLSTSRALRYVESYAMARFGSTDPQRARDIVEKLSGSIEQNLTAQLMSTPLQVTFMVTVVAAKGDPGEDRWQLFSSYYRTVYDRERQKAVRPYDSVLSKQQALIDRLHHDVGFLLQQQGEQATEKFSSFPLSKFESLVDQYLDDAGHDEANKKQLATMIVDAARHRLVFLTSRISDEISFDVRSLQEYMAAECLMTGSQEAIKHRLQSIAPSRYWRNVFLFAVSKCFRDAQSRHLQDTIRVLCEDLNNGQDALLVAGKEGSELALAILQSGAVSENPNHARGLAKVAIEAVSIPHLSNDWRHGASHEHQLAMTYRDELMAVFRNELELRIGHSDFSHSVWAWPLLIRLMSRNIPWANQLGDKCWPSEISRQEKLILNMPEGLAEVSWLRKRLRMVIRELPPSKAEKLELVGPHKLDVINMLDIPWIKASRSRKSGIALSISGKIIQEIQLLFTTLGGDWKLSASEINVAPKSTHPGWLPFFLAERLLVNPSKEVLSKILEDCAASGWNRENSSSLFQLPWPLACCLECAQNANDLREMATQAKQGVFGDFEDWNAAEERWKLDGIRLEDFEPSSAGLPFNKDIRIRGYPRSMSWSLSPFTDLEDMKKIFTLGSILDKNIAGAIIFSFNFALERSRHTPNFVTPSRLKTFIERHCSKGEFWGWQFIEYPKNQKIVKSWLSFFDWLGRSDFIDSVPIPFYFDDGRGMEWCTVIQEEFIKSNAANRSLGLLQLLSQFAQQGVVLKLVPLNMLHLSNFTNRRDQLAAMLVNLSRPDMNMEEIPVFSKLCETIFEGEDKEQSNILIRTIEAHLGRSPAVLELVLRLHVFAVEHSLPISADLAGILESALQKRPSDLQESGMLKQLGLPVIQNNTFN